MKKIIFNSLFTLISIGGIFYSCKKDKALSTSSNPQPTAYDLRIPYSNWILSSTPSLLFPESAMNNSLTYGYNRAKLAWYIIDPTYFKTTQNSVYTKQVLQSQVFPNDPVITGLSYLNTLDLAFYPNERGPYNYDLQNINADGTFNNPQSRWGGIMRRLEVTDFEATGIQFIEFWLMDPFKYNQSNNGELYFQLGNISEDVLKDSKMFYENGLNDSTKSDSSVWGLSPKVKATNNSFDTDPSNRAKQDIGFDGLPDSEESSYFSSFLANAQSVLNSTALSNLQIDPSTDDYIYREDVGSDDVLLKYKNFNGSEDNS